MAKVLTPRTLIGDPNRLQQVMWNLLSNSIKFSLTGGIIDVNLNYTDSHAEIQVQDTGLGISADFLPYVFERFRQGNSSTRKSNSGLGLGLAIVRHLVELHGGTVEAASLGKDKGATFTVRLPLHNNLEESDIKLTQELFSTPALPAAPVSYPSLAGVRVLIVDDEPDLRQLFRIVLEDYDVQVTEATSAQEALSTLKTNPSGYDVILSDIGLPEEDGYALMRQIRALSAEKGGKIPAAALTGYTGEAEQAESLAAGFQLHINKPVEPDQLVNVVAVLAKRSVNR